MDEECQNEELTVLESIYDETVFTIDRINEPSGRVVIHPTLSDHYFVKYQIKVNENPSNYIEFQVKYLPPIILHFVLPKTYPSVVNPAFLLSCCWLTNDQLSSLCKKLDKLWLEGGKEVILFKWIQFLQEEVLLFLRINESLDISDIFDQNSFKRTISQNRCYRPSKNNSQISLHWKQEDTYQKMHKDTFPGQLLKKCSDTIPNSKYQEKHNTNNSFKEEHSHEGMKYQTNINKRTNCNINHVSESEVWNDELNVCQRTCVQDKHCKWNNRKDNYQNKSLKNENYNSFSKVNNAENFNLIANKKTYPQNQNSRCWKENYQCRINNTNSPNLEKKLLGQKTNEKNPQTQYLEKEICQAKNYENKHRKKNKTWSQDRGGYHRSQQKESSDFKDNRDYRRFRNKWVIRHKDKVLIPRISGGNSLIDLRAVSEIESRSTLISCLTRYTKDKEEETYNSTWFTCGVCLEEKQGKDFMNFSGCNHRYCKVCLKSYFEIQIQEGNVKSLSCPNEKCVSQATPYQISELVNPDLYSRYDKLLLKSILECMSDVVYCPRIFCQTPVILEPDCSMGICTQCEFVFCIYCKMVYHGVASCQFKTEERKKIREEYLKADKETKYKMECRYGRRTLQMLVDEVLSEEWVEKNSKKCPKCNSSIEKIDGCNKMTCWKCQTFFCWICMLNLNPANPYEHYSNPDNTCFKQLFQGVEEFSDDDDEDWDVGAFL